MSILSVQNLKKSFSKVEVLKSLSLNFEEGSHYVIKGTSGSGKSTFLYLLGGLDRPSDGSIKFNGSELGKLNDEKLATYRNENVGFIFQFHFLLSNLKCLDNILLPARIGGKETQSIEKRAKELAEHLQVSHCLDKFPYELSGGEQQRVNIIRALSLRPKLLLCDEPTGNLDSMNSMKVTKLLKDVAKEIGATLIVVTHDHSVASEFENVLEMKDGVLI